MTERQARHVAAASASSIAGSGSQCDGQDAIAMARTVSSAPAARSEHRGSRRRGALLAACSSSAGSIRCVGGGAIGMNTEVSIEAISTQPSRTSPGARLAAEQIEHKRDVHRGRQRMIAAARRGDRSAA
jgi:hypothetical protein